MDFSSVLIIDSSVWIRIKLLESLSLSLEESKVSIELESIKVRLLVGLGLSKL